MSGGHSSKACKGDCGVCGKANLTRLPFKEADPDRRATRPLERVHIDVADVSGANAERSLGGHRYYLEVVDDYSRHVDLILLREKSEVTNKLIAYLTFWSRHLGSKVKYIRMDNGSENLTSEFQMWCRRSGVQLELTVPYTPQQNGVAERMNRSVASLMRALLVQSGLATRFWGFAARMAAHIINVSPTSANPDRSPPDHRFFQASH